MAEQFESKNQTPGSSYEPQKKSGYGKKPWWFWFLVYLVIGAIVYAAIYLFFFSGSTNSPNGLY